MTSGIDSSAAGALPIHKWAGRFPLGRENLLPALLTALLVAAALIWNAQAGLRWTVELAILMLVPAACLLLLLVYATVRPNPVIAEMALYIGLWFIYPVFGTQLTYLANRVGFPLRDATFDAWDRLLGFSWLEWTGFVTAHPVLHAVQRFAYESCLWQAPLIVIVLALGARKGRNAEFLTSMLLALSATMLVNMLWPSLGPAALNGFKSQTADIILALRAGSTEPYHYAGVIAFPSYHTVIAILYTAACRGQRLLFPGALLLNGLMLSAIPYSGNHYLVDMLAGAIIAAIALYGARQLQAAAARPITPSA